MVTLYCFNNAIPKITASSAVSRNRRSTLKLLRCQSGGIGIVIGHRFPMRDQAGTRRRPRALEGKDYEAFRNFAFRSLFDRYTLGKGSPENGNRQQAIAGCGGLSVTWNAHDDQGICAIYRTFAGTTKMTTAAALPGQNDPHPTGDPRRPCRRRKLYGLWHQPGDACIQTQKRPFVVIFVAGGGGWWLVASGGGWYSWFAAV